MRFEDDKNCCVVHNRGKIDGRRRERSPFMEAVSSCPRRVYQEDWAYCQDGNYNEEGFGCAAVNNLETDLGRAVRGEAGQVQPGVGIRTRVKS